ncbi:formate dehydrogenase subunit gamma [Rhodovulum iodosum]|nr:formate dehydrogenase subunit gamma [Rhodovulum robiginosum]
MERLSFAVLMMLALTLAAPAQEVAAPPPAPVTERQTLDDILARQKGESAARHHRDTDSAAGQAESIGGQLGTLGGASDSDVWEALRFGTADVKVSAGGAPARVVMQDRGMWWLTFREGRLSNWGFFFWIGLVTFLVIFYLLRGRIMVSGGLSGIKVVRFTAIERFAHWMLAGSLMLLGATGLLLLFGRTWFMPYIGKDIYATIAHYSKLVHNNVSWAFMLGLVLVFLFWVHHNVPRRIDLTWFAQGGGIFGNKHPPARKFNAGQKILFWTVILLGASVSASGLSLIFPFEFNLFAPTFATLNDLGVPALLGMDPFPTQLSPQEEMQFAQLWHVIASFGLMALTTAHIYIGTIGMQGAFHAMGSGEVDLNWANDHHKLWVEEMDEKTRRLADKVSPAE